MVIPLNVSTVYSPWVRRWPGPGGSARLRDAALVFLEQGPHPVKLGGSLPDR